MKITNELKIIMQINSFIGMVAAGYLIKTGVHVPLSYVGLGINAFFLILWTFIEEDNETNQPPK